MLGTSTVGNKSLIIPLNKGKSYSKNLGTFESLIARISTMSSLKSGFLRRNYPAITKTLLTALIPKS